MYANAPVVTWNRSLFANRPMNWIKGVAAEPIIAVTPYMPVIPPATPLGTVVARIDTIMSDGTPYVGSLVFGAPNFDDGGRFAITGTHPTFSLIINPSGPGVGSLGSTLQHVNVVATQ